MAFRQKYRQFVERQGFALMTVVCVAVIAACAVWTRQTKPRSGLPASTDQTAAAADLWQQPLRDAATPTPAPTKAPAVWRAPLASVEPLTDYDPTRLAPSGLPGVWRAHDGVDLAAEAGQPVLAMANGTILAVETDGVCGACATVAHDGGVTVDYMGMAELAEVSPGDAVRAGQTLGFAGGNILEERHLPCHIHLRATRDGETLDPLSLLDQP